jgi:hypothetical protein
MSSPVKAALEDLLRARKLQAEAPPLRGEGPRATLLPTGLGAVDNLIGGGLPRGQLSEIHGPASSGRTGLALALIARTTGRGSLAAWLDPADRFDPASAEAAGVDLTRLLWLRGRALSEALAAGATLVGSGLFEVIALDLAAVAPRELRRLPGTTWIRLQRLVAPTPSALLLLSAGHVACGPGGVSLALQPARPRWSGVPGPGRLLRGLNADAAAVRLGSHHAAFTLHAL